MNYLFNSANLLRIFSARFAEDGWLLKIDASPPPNLSNAVARPAGLIFS